MDIRKYFLTIFLTLLYGCVSIDGRSSKEPIDRIATASISGNYSNNASYKSTGEFVAIDNFSELIEIKYHESQSFFISFNNNKDLIIKFDGAEKEIIYKLSEDYKIQENGSILLLAKTRCGGDGTALGCNRRQITIFINTNGNLVTIQSGLSGGLAFIVPVGIYAKHMAIFPEIK